MVAGLKFHCHRLRWRAGFVIPELEAAGREIYAGATMTSYWTPNPVDKVIGIRLAVTSSTIGTDTTTVSLEIPASGIAESFDVAGFQSEAEAELVIEDLRQINAFTVGVGYVQRVTWATAQLYLDGSLVWTGDPVAVESPRMAASGIPLFGVPPTLSSSAGFGPVPTAGSFADCPEGVTVNVAAEVYGGWEIQWTVGGEWQSAPIAFSPPAVSMPEDCPCDPGLPEAVVISAERTDEVRVRAGATLIDTCELIAENDECDPCPPGTLASTPQIRNVYRATRTMDNWGGEVMLLPNVEKSVRRWKPADYRQMVFRGGFPQVKANAVASCGPWVVSGEGTISRVVNPQLFPSQTSILSNVGNPPHAIEDSMSYPSYAPGQVTRSRGQSVLIFDETLVPAMCIPEGGGGDEDYPSCDLPDPTTCFVSETRIGVHSVEDGLSNPHILGALDHADPICRYIDTVCSPHWSYFTWFPANTLDTDEDGLADSQDRWPVLGDAIPVEYWLRVRQQWGFHPALPDAERTRRRTSLPMDPLYWGHLSPVVRDQIGVDSNWWGQQNFIVDDWLPPLSLAYSPASADLISTEDCSVDPGSSGVTVHPNPFETTVTVDFDLASLTSYPYLYPQLASEIEVFVEESNVVSFQVLLVGAIAGETKLLTSSNGRFARPIGMDAGFAFSFQDHGVGMIEDLGEDLLPIGHSDETMADAERVNAFQMLAGRGAAKLRFRLTLVSADEPAVIRWPRFYASEEEPIVVDENGFHQIVAWPNGPAIRFGNLTWLLGFTLSLPPGYDSPFYFKASIVDWLKFKRLFSGLDPADGLAAELAELFDGSEVIGESDADSLTLSCLIGHPGRRFPLAVLVPTYRETPPSAGLPLRARDADRQPTGVLAQQCWTHAEERVLILANQEIHYWSEGERFTEPLGSYLGWKLTGHRQALTNSEGPFRVQRGTTVLGQTRPWRGLFGIDSRLSSARQLDVTSDPCGRMWWAHVTDD